MKLGKFTAEKNPFSSK